eukprot:52233-Eustigmatos_ZCMA.PRE.1
MRRSVDPLVMKYAYLKYCQLGASQYEAMRQMHPGMPAMSTVRKFKSMFKFTPGLRVQLLEHMRDA